MQRPRPRRSHRPLLERQIVNGGELRRVVIVLVAAAAGLPGLVAAQGTPPDTTAADTTRVLWHEGITVRALRTPLPLAAVPYAVSVRTMAERPPSAALTLAEALRSVPGLQVQSRYNEALGERIVMRGFGARAQFGVRGVHVAVDGIPATMADGQTTLNHLDLGLLHRAEVLRGPAAAAYGNAAGGVLLLSTVPPSLAPSPAAAAATTGSDGLVRLRGIAAGGGEVPAWVASVAREWRDGYRPHSGADRWQLTGRVDAPVAGGFLRLVTRGVAYDADNPGGLTPEQYASDPHQAQAFNVAQRTGEDGRHAQVGAAWERAYHDVWLEAAGYGLVRSLANPIPPAIIDLDRTAAGGRVLVRGGGDGLARARWAAGLDAAVLGDERRNHGNDGGERGELTLDQSERVASVAAHAQALVPLLDRLGLFLAARYDRVAFQADDRLITAEDPDDSGRRAMDAFSPTAGVRLDLTDDLSLIANVGTAFETPTTTELVNRPDGAGGFNPALEPQRTVSYEAGVRATIAGGVRLEATGYRARIRDALVPFEVESAPGRQYFRNAAGAVHQGGELMVEVRTDAVDLIAGYSRTDAAFTSYATDDASFDGRTVPGVRPWTLGMDVLVRAMSSLTLELGYESAGGMPVDDANDAHAPGYHLFDLRGAVPVRAGPWTVRLHAGVDNALGETYVASVVPNAFGARYFEPGPGRSFYLGAEVGMRARDEPASPGDPPR